MFSERLRPMIEPITSNAGRTLARAHVSPNAMTMLGLVAVLGCAWLIAIERTRLAGVLLIPAVILDLLDGAIARASSRVTPWGSFLDSVADRISDGALLGAVIWAAQGGPRRETAAALCALVLSMAVPYARAKAESLGYTVPSGPGERGERAAVLILGLIFERVEIAMWVISVLALWTLLLRSLAVRRAASRTA